MANPFASTSATTQIQLVDYVDTLAALPNELTRAFSDLRELDAVLRTSIEAITRKILLLTSMIETKGIAPAERLNLLLEIAHDAQHLKMGTEDKIRVSGKACEELTITRREVNDLLGEIVSNDGRQHFNNTLHVHQTTYPHVAPESLRPAQLDHHGRRKRVPPAASSAANARDPYAQVTPVKKRRIDDDVSSVRTGTVAGRGGPKPKTLATAIVTATAKAKGKTLNDPPSPTSTDFATGPYRASNGNSRNNSGRVPTVGGKQAAGSSSTGPGRGGRIGTGANARGDDGASSAAGGRGRGANLLDMVASRGAGGRNAFDDDDYASSAAAAVQAGRRAGSPDGGTPVTGAGGSASGHQPSSRAAANRSRATVAAAAHEDYVFETEEQTYDDDVDPFEDPGDIQGDPDEKTYCYCNRVSFGQMVGCDDDKCEKEWFHLICIGFKNAPTGAWYCDDCIKRREKKKPRPRAAPKPAAGGGAKKPKAPARGASKADDKDAKKEKDSATGSGTNKSKSKSTSPDPPDGDTPADADTNAKDGAGPSTTKTRDSPVDLDVSMQDVPADDSLKAKVELLEDSAGLPPPPLDVEVQAPTAPESAEMEVDDVPMVDGSIPIDPALSNIPV